MEAVGPFFVLFTMEYNKQQEVCNAKKAYTFLSDAREAADRITNNICGLKERKGSVWKRSSKATAYECRVCGKYHIATNGGHKGEKKDYLIFVCHDLLTEKFVQIGTADDSGRANDIAGKYVRNHLKKICGDDYQKINRMKGRVVHRVLNSDSMEE